MEQLCLQVGNDANFVATHFWNSQEAQQRDVSERRVLFEEGDLARPRALLVDYAHSVGQLSLERGVLVRQQQNEGGANTASTASSASGVDGVLWNEGVSTLADDGASDSALTRAVFDGAPASPTLDSLYWSDYLVGHVNSAGVHQV